MKAVLEFNLPEDSDLHLKSLYGPALHDRAEAFRYYLRNRLKHERLNKVQYELMETVYTQYCETFDIPVEP